ncbi:MAG TPA: hypothetical protein VFI31_23385 [Pirellulales bacterium]|nr:hypothetical protein [Pirellulales bacterium]
MASRSANAVLVRLLVAAALWLDGRALLACPFCTSLRPTLTQECERADLAFLGELASAKDTTWNVRVHRVLKSGDGLSKQIALVEPICESGDVPHRGSLLLALGTRKPGTTASDVAWKVVALDELSFGYVAQAPTFKKPAVERLPYFLDYLENADPLVAEDAYLEFGHAPFDEIVKLAARLPIDRLRAWLADEGVSTDRKGLYGLLLGVAAEAQSRHDVADDFWKWINAPASDFRSGFDGVLGGYLWLDQGKALARLEHLYLDDPHAPSGNLRHLITALRVYHDYGRGIPQDELLKVYRRLLEKPELAAAAIADLRRWRDWQALDRVASLFGRPGYDEAAIEREIIAYLLACPLPAAQPHVARLRRLVPDRVKEAERLQSSETEGE